MISKITKLLSVLIVVAISLYIVMLNNEALTVRLPGKEITTNSGIVLIAVFAMGILSAAVVSVFFGIKSYFRERRLQSKERKRQQFYQGMLNARSALAAGDWQKARDRWEAIIQKDPTDIIARVELSKSLEGAGELREALKVIDTARTHDAENVEVLMRAAELNLLLGNKTAAVDNLALVLYHHPNSRAAELARELSEELNRIDDAIEYQSQYERLTGKDDAHKEIVTRLRYRKLLEETKEDADAQYAELQKFARQHPECAPALLKLSRLESEKGNIDSAAKLLFQAGKQSGLTTYWQHATELWVSHDMPDRALSAARTATKETRGEDRLRAELDLIRVYIKLNMLEEAHRGIENFDGLSKSEGVKMTPEFAQQLLILKGLCLNSMGKYQESARVWKQLSHQDYELKHSKLEVEMNLNGQAPPAPRLSTP